MFNNDEWSVGFVNWSYMYQGQLASDQQKTESDREQDVQYLSKELQHSLLQVISTISSRGTTNC